MIRQVLAAAAALTFLTLAGCSREEPKEPMAPKPNALTMNQEDMSAKALEILNRRCTVCHTSERFSARAFTSDEWNAVLQRMVAKGAQVSGGELDVLRHWRKSK